MPNTSVVQFTKYLCLFTTIATASCVMRDTTVIAVVGNGPLTVVCDSFAAAKAFNHTTEDTVQNGEKNDAA